ncbi:MAG: NlpC/P60 family protein [Clostridiaceae bacterium]
MKKKAISSILAFCLILAFSVTVYADPISDERAKLQEQQNQYNSIDGNIDSNQLSIDKLEQIVEKMDNDISVLSGEISEANTKISSKEKDIANTQEEIDKLVKEIDEKQQLLDTRVRAMYINGNDSYLSFLLDSKGFSDLISRMEFVKKIVTFDKGIIEDLNNSREKIEDKKKVLEKEKSDLVALKSDLEKAKAEISAKKKAQQNNLDSLQAKQSDLEENKADYKKKIAESTKKIEDLIRAMQNTTPSRGVLKTGMDIVSYASNFLGIRYVWGANGPNSFDCSGFVTYVFDHFGINLRDYPGQRPTTYSQIYHGTYVPRNQLQPGDVIFFGSSNATVHHVAIYCGNDTYIHAPQTGDVIKYSILSYRSDYLTARRMY